MRTMPDCPNCGNDELYSLALPHDGNRDAYLQAGVRCYACAYASDDPPRWWQTEPGVFLVRVPDTLQDTPLGWLYAWRFVPRLVRGASPYWKTGEVRAGSYRWWEFRTEARRA